MVQFPMVDGSMVPWYQVEYICSHENPVLGEKNVLSPALNAG